MALETDQLPSAFHLPDPDHPIITGGNPLVIRGKGRGKDDIAVAIERKYFAATGGLPDLGGPIVAGRHDALAVRRESGSPNPIVVSSESEQVATTRGIPQPGCQIMTGGKNSLAIGGERNRTNPVVVP